MQHPNRKQQQRKHRSKEFLAKAYQNIFRKRLNPEGMLSPKRPWTEVYDILEK